MALPGYKAYQKNVGTGMGPHETLAFLVGKVAECVVTMMEAMKANDYEKRFNESEKAILVLTNLTKTMTPEDENGKKVIAELETYYSTLATLISRLNINNDMESAESIHRGLLENAESWKKLAFEKQSQAPITTYL